MDALLRRRAMFAAGGSPTPPTPTPTFVDYIETDGTAYIDTGILGNIPKSFEISLKPVLPSSGNTYILATRKDSGNTRFFPLLFNANGCAGYAYAGNIYNSSSSGIDCSSYIQSNTTIIVRVSLTNGSQYFGVKPSGGTYTTRHNTLSSSINTERSLFLFGFNAYDGSVSVCESGTQINYVKIFGNADYTGLVFDGSACVHNGEFGMWDSISDSFFGNAAGSGAFSGPSNL